MVFDLVLAFDEAIAAALSHLASLLLEDGFSYLLLEDGSSHLLLE